MQALKQIHKFLQRIKHPISQPEDIGKDLGIQVLYNELSFEECIDRLSSNCASKYLKRFQPREEVEPLFKTAVRKETFKDTSLFSYYLFDGWLAFKLVFDDQSVPVAHGSGKMTIHQMLYLFLINCDLYFKL